MVSPGTRSVPALAKATALPSADSDGEEAEPLRVTFVVVPAFRSRTKTFSPPPLSPLVRLVAREMKASTAPSALSDGLNDASSAWAPPGPRLTRVVVLDWRS